MKKTKVLIFVLSSFFMGISSFAQVEDEAIDVEFDYNIREVNRDYGIDDGMIETHVYLNTALYNFEHQFLGNYANVGSSLSGHPLVVNYSGYISISGYISNTLFAEAEFELYKGQKGQVKVTRLRGVWSPNKNFKLTLGRDFPPIGIQDKIYYPTSKYRMFAIAPMLYWSVMHATGWWDSGIHLYGAIPIGENSKIMANLSVINGPGDQHHSGNYLANIMRPNDQGYMFEAFHTKARQPWDNNSSKHIASRLAFSPIKDMEFGTSYMFGKYDKEDKYSADYLFGHFLYGGKRLTIAAEYGQLMVQVPDSNLNAPAFTDIDGNVFENKNIGEDKITQYSWYISAGYKFLVDTKIHYIEPVVRYEFLDSWREDAMNKGDRQLIWAGIRFSPIKHWVLKAAYLYQTETYKDLDNDGFVLEAVFDF